MTLGYFIIIDLFKQYPIWSSLITLLVIEVVTLGCTGQEFFIWLYRRIHRKINRTQGRHVIRIPDHLQTFIMNDTLVPGTQLEVKKERPLTALADEFIITCKEAKMNVETTVEVTEVSQRNLTIQVVHDYHKKHTPLSDTP